MTAIVDVAVSQQEEAAVVDWERYQVDHLFVLVGGNPLPNAVAAQLLVAPGGTVHLMHTARSAPVATRLGRWLSDRRLGVVHHTVGPETSEIVAAVTPVVTPLVGQRVGLHYTGGTKRMAVHVYDAVAAALAAADPRAWFSYLDARTLTMRLHRADPLDGAGVAVQPAGLAAPLTLRELIVDLQGWTLPPFSVTVQLPGSAAALRQLHLQAAGEKAWKGWLDREQGRDPLTLPENDRLRAVVAELRRELNLGAEQALSLDLLAQALHLTKMGRSLSKSDRKGGIQVAARQMAGNGRIRGVARSAPGAFPARREG